MDRGFRLRPGCHRQEAPGLEASLYTLLQVFSVTLFEKMPMSQAFSESTTTFEDGELSNQLNLFDY